MSYGGIFGGDVLGTLHWAGIGAVPSECWDTPGFKACQAAQYEVARNTCDPKYGGSFAGYASVSDCITKQHSINTEGICVEQFCPQAAPGTQVIAGKGSAEDQKNYPWKQKSAATVALQKQINAGLATFGKCPIGTDGYLGAETCGAAKFLFGQGGPTMVSVPTTCSAFTAPGNCPTNGKAPSPPPPSEPKDAPATQKSSALMWGGIAALAAVGVYLATRKR